MSDARELFGDEIADAIFDLRMLTGFDALRNPDFWERWVATQLGGEQTDRRAPYDVTVEIWGKTCLAEVKFSRAFFAEYGKWSRHIFKWLMSKPQVANRTADAIILIGVDQDSSIYSWILPREAVPTGKRSITITAPSDRRPKMVGRIDPYIVPVTELLPAFASACHNRHDNASRRSNARKTIAAKSGQIELL